MGEQLKAKREAAEKREEAERAAKEAAKPKMVTIDAWDSVSLGKQEDVDKLVERCCDKLNNGKCKDGAFFFLNALIKQLDAELSTDELKAFQKVVDTMAKEQKKVKGEKQAVDKKATTKLSKNTKFNASAEWQEVYGGGADDEDWTQEEYDEWYKQEAAA